MAVRATIRTPMPVKMRAKQFMMFDAMKGLTEAIAEREESYTPRKELSESRIEEINKMLQMLQKGDRVNLLYYCSYGRQYREATGIIVRIDLFWNELQVGETVIGFSEIDEIRKSETL